MSDSEPLGGASRCHRELDPGFGPVNIETDLALGRVVVQAASFPDVVIERTRDVRLHDYIPIGTRDPSALQLLVDGRVQGLLPAKPGLSRRSYRVHAHVDDGAVLFTPSGPSTSRLVRGTAHRGDTALGIFQRQKDGAVVATWSEDATVLGVTAKAQVPAPTEAALGYVLAAAFGTGALFFLGALFSSWVGELPG